MPTREGSFILKFVMTAFTLRCVQRPHGEHISDKFMQPTTDSSITRARLFEIAPKRICNILNIVRLCTRLRQPLSDNISMATSRRRSHGWSAGAQASHASLKGYFATAVRILASWSAACPKTACTRMARKSASHKSLPRSSARSLASDTRKSREHSRCPGSSSEG